MRFKRILNNNCVVAADHNNQEHILMGKGISFGLKKGDDIDLSKAERVFSQLDKQNIKLIAEIGSEYIDLASVIIDGARETLNKELQESLYITLADHLQFVHQRCDQGIFPKNSLKWEIRNYYPEEYRIGLKAVVIMQDEFGIVLPDDEAASIALHIINAENEQTLHDSIDGIAIIDQIMQIIRLETQVEICENSTDYQRLLAHVKFFVQRICMQKEKTSEENTLFHMIRKNYEDEYLIAVKIKEFIEKKYLYHVDCDEVTYLSIHLHRIMSHNLKT